MGPVTAHHALQELLLPSQVQSRLNHVINAMKANTPKQALPSVRCVLQALIIWILGQVAVRLVLQDLGRLLGQPSV